MATFFDRRGLGRSAAPAGRDFRVIDRVAAAMAHLFYRVDVAGRPQPDGPLLLLPNHFNALLDPALVMATAGRPVRFLAKSTLFHGFFRPLLGAASAIPVYRKQDGVETGRNDETFAAVHAALARGDAVCVFPEGISHSSGRLEELRTGAARMALSAAASGIDVHMVPVGINLERKTTFRSRATVAYGAPFRAAAAETDADAVRRLTRQIGDHMRALLVEADPDGDAHLIERLNRLYVAGRGAQDDAAADVERRKTIADALRRVRLERPEFYASALIQLRRYDDRLRRFGLTDDALDWDVSHTAALTFIATEVPLAVLLLPVAVAAMVTFAVPYGLTALASRITRETDVTATVKVVAGTLIYSMWMAVLVGLAWWWGGWLLATLALMTVPVLAVGGLLAIERESSAWQTVRSWLAARDARHITRTALRRRRAELADVLDEVHAWISSAEADRTASADPTR
jgi:glycerol-3-phosphate O-acyltransferase / dihydroxyacetone phosphate acyltransferase